MEDLTKHFPGCKMTTEQIRETIRKILGIDPYSHFFCYRCFKHVGETSTTAICCAICFQPYCDYCAKFYVGAGTSGIDSSKCGQCAENNYIPEWS
jgi:hypothetical protein